MMPIVSKIYCSSSQVVLVVRKRPHVVNGGGFVVTDLSQKVVFKVDGCGILGTKDELILRDADGEALLLVRRKGGMVEALSIYRTWKGYSYDYEGAPKLVFSLKEPNNSCLASNNVIRISVGPKGTTGKKDWDFEINGYFPDRNCSIVDSRSGNIVAQVGVKKEVDVLMASKDFYHVVVKPGIDQAFVFGVIATLDYIYGESTRC
ncbi:LURP1-related protein domain containing protein [Trema orientale]|uniref:LURP1-related protein domain containing protein n=1 Tax=Trema orientale TaxID=63057 RepID=A0A2P5AP23_TREOI|nr:LURP1-related protein domain containing protein [Trema orientale]